MITPQVEQHDATGVRRLGRESHVGKQGNRGSTCSIWLPVPRLFLHMVNLFNEFFVSTVTRPLARRARYALYNHVTNDTNKLTWAHRC